MKAIKFIIQDGLTANNVTMYKQQFERMIHSESQYEEMVLDLAETENIDSVGVTFVINVYKRLKSLDKHFRVEGASKDVQSLFKLMKLDQFFEMTD